MTRKVILVFFIAVFSVNAQAQGEPPNNVFWKELEKLTSRED